MPEDHQPEDDAYSPGVRPLTGHLHQMNRDFGRKKALLPTARPIRQPSDSFANEAFYSFLHKSPVNAHRALARHNENLRKKQIYRL